MIPWWALALLIFGLNSTLWGSVGLARLLDQSIFRRIRPRREPVYPGNVVAFRDDPGGRRARQINLTVDDVAILIPAHNEGAVIEDSLRAIMKLVPRKNIHVVSDGSTDDTFEIALRVGVKAIKTLQNVGKAGALQEAIQRFRLVDRFPVVMLLDADTRVQPGYFDAALPLFDSLAVVAVAGCVKIDVRRMLSPVGNLLVGHRMRIYAMGQRVLKFGQTSRHLNATPIVPGFASIYRTAVLPRMQMNPPGLVIEDFNMTFEVYQKRLGKVGFTLGAVAVTQDPDNFRDYIKQTRRWALGLWQTIRRHPPRFNLFTAMLSLMLLELITSSLLFVILPFILLILVIPDLFSSAAFWPVFGSVHTFVAAHMTLGRILFGVLVPDLAITALVAAIERRPRLLLATPFFPFMRVLDAALGLYSIPLAWLSTSSGRWKSPTRHGVHRRSELDEALPGLSGLEVPVAAAAAIAAQAPPAAAYAAEPSGPREEAFGAESHNVPG
ncbi:MAG TPA: glycosyltransferase family 2 protein [Streptosporangiaceae bacterium]|nr:glycosyltransferase family 2 protein [Streptosporangiaceae bacterium]